MSPVAMSTRAILRMILTGQRSDGARREAATELFLRGKCTLVRAARLCERGWWAAREVGEEAF